MRIITKNMQHHVYHLVIDVTISIEEEKRKQDQQLEDNHKKQRCEPCFRKPPPEKLKETNILQGLSQQHHELQTNPEKKFNYPITHTLLLPSETSSRFVVDVPNDSLEPTKVIPIEVLHEAYLVWRKQLDEEASQQFTQGQY
jgi:hypothetical protein